MKLKMRSLVVIILAAFLLPTGCKKEDGHIQPIGKNGFLASLYNADVPLAWFKEAVSLSLATPGTTPPVASRTFGYMGLALYESVVPGMPDNKSIQHQLNGLPELPQVEGHQIILLFGFRKCRISQHDASYVWECFRCTECYH